MRLLHLKLLSKFRGLAPETEFIFDNGEQVKEKIEPICLVGVNGSGKSNLMEVIAEIFYYLELYKSSSKKTDKRHQTRFGFEISYELNLNLQAAKVSWEKFAKLSFETKDTVKVTVKKQPKQIPTITLSVKEKIYVENNSDPDYFILPLHVISYSSGQNELISNPFIRTNYHYFDELNSEKSRNISEELDLSRLFHIDYEASKLITISNYLFARKNNVDMISEEVEVDDLDSFSIVIRSRNYRNNKIEFAGIIQKSIEDLKSCATTFEEKNGEANFRELKLSYKVDDEMRRAFENSFGSAIRLYSSLFFLNVMNIHCHPKETRDKIKNSGSLDDNLSYLIPVPPRERLVFIVEKVKFKKQGEKEPIKYKNLSDGEHQLMHVLGSIMLLNLSGSILLFDEPETHFNPEWRSQLITFINKAASEKNKVDKFREQEIIISSHSPFIVSDCRRERVFVFEKGGKATNPSINTFGTSVNILTEEIFKKTESISGQSMEKIEEIKKLPLTTPAEIETAKEASRVLGESVEKVLLFREFIIRENELKGNDKKL